MSSDQRYRVDVLPSVRVTMRDGTELAARITKPIGEGPFPAVMAYSPYRMLAQVEKAPTEDAYFNGFHGPYYLAERGFVCINYDARGTGDSGGTTSSLYSDEERQDGYEMVQWIASQPWCNGSVGMWGKSFGAVVALQIAAMAPPALKAIIVRSGTDDLYSDWACPGGSPRSLFVLGSYASTMTASNFAPPSPTLEREKWNSVWREHLSGNMPWTFASLENQTLSAYWSVRSVRPNIDRIKCAVLLIEGWADWYYTAALRLFKELKGPKKVIIGPWAHYWPEDAYPGPRIDARQIYRDWFEQHLNGVDTALAREPAVSIFVRTYAAPSAGMDMDNGQFRFEAEWPPARAKMERLFLSPTAELSAEEPNGECSTALSFEYKPSVGAMSGIVGQGSIPPFGMALDQRPDEASSLTFTSRPYRGDFEICGNPTVKLHVSSSADVAYFQVRVSDVAPDGTSKLITSGGLNATRRKSHESPEPLVPEQVYSLVIELKAVAYVVQKGHRLRVAISGADFQNVWPVGKPAQNRVFSNSEYPSFLDLPTVVPGEAPHGVPNYASSPVFQTPCSDLRRPLHTISTDLCLGTTTVELEGKIALANERTRFTVSDTDPAVATMSSVATYIDPSQPNIIVRAECITDSDSTHFGQKVVVDIQVDGKPHTFKSWARRFPRVLN